VTLTTAKQDLGLIINISTESSTQCSVAVEGQTEGCEWWWW